MTFNIGDKVHYRPSKDCDPSLYENGMVKKIVEQGIFVVYACGGEWNCSDAEIGSPARVGLQSKERSHVRVLDSRESGGRR